MNSIGHSEPHTCCIQVQSVNKFYGKTQVLHDITLDIRHAEIFGMLGPSGAGKTTLVKMIAGIENVTSGTVSVLNTEMPNLSMMGRIGFMAQSDALYNELTAVQNLEFFAGIYGLRGHRAKQRIQYVADLVKLSSDLKKPVAKYSGGMKRRLSLAISLLHEPEILVLDEPTVGIDPILRKSIWDELENLRSQGITVVVTTHVMDEAEKCMRLAMIRDGQLLAVGSPEELKGSTSSHSLEEAFLQYGALKVEV